MEAILGLLSASRPISARKGPGAFLEENNYMSVHLQTLQYQVSRNRSKGNRRLKHTTIPSIGVDHRWNLAHPVFRRLGPDEVLKWVRTESEQLLGTQNAEAGPETLDRMAHLFEFAPSEKDVQDTRPRSATGLA